ncbi:MAG: outer membrane beta-barrel protein [Janthinobacterium lividum]
MKNAATFRAALLTSLLALAGAAHAQTSLRGTVQDAAGHALPFANALLLHLPDSTVAQAQTTTEQGDFTFERVPAGRYCLKALQLGYAPARSAAVVVGTQAVVVPPLRLAATTTALKEVVVQGRPSVLEQLADRTVVNVDRLNTAGDNALEVLKKAPGVTLDKDDHVVYRGSGSVLVLLDGKQSYLSGDALTNYLKSLPASAISQIELLPNPPASMEAAGTAGVINIRTRRSTRPGLTGTASGSAGYGTYERGNAGANLAYNVGKVRSFGRLSVVHSNSFNRLLITRQIRDTTFAQENYWHPDYNGLSYAAGADVALTKRQTLGAQVRGSYGRTDAQVSSTSVATAASGQPAGSLAMSNPKNDHGTDLAFNLNYRLALDTTGRELTADADLLHYVSAGHQDFNPLNSPPAGAAGALVGPQRSDEASDVVIRSLKTDYVHPLPGHWRAEAGAKASLVTTRSALAFDKLASDATWHNDPLRTNQFTYDEAIAAAYATVSTSLQHLELKAGLRGEHTHSVGESATTGQRVARDYFQLFPTLFAAYKLGERDQLSFSAGRRISRPSYQSLNPFVNYTDAYTAMQGNPFLAPSLARSFVLGFVHRDFQVLSLSYLLETDVVSEVAYQNDQTKVTTTRPQNLDRALTLTLTSGGHTDLSKVWGMDNQLVVGYSNVQTQVEAQAVQLRRVAWSLNSDHTFRLPHQFQLLVGGYYAAPDVQGLFYTKASGALNLGLKKQLLGERATLSFKMADVFSTSRFRSTMDYNNIHLTWSNQWESRRASLSFSYKLGSGKTHTSHASGSTDEEGRAGH